jgi:hypothetical protein
MVTRPQHGLVLDRIATEERRLRSGTPCPRLRFFAETRKRDDGDASIATRRKALVLKFSATVREANARGRKPPESIMNRAG